MNNRSLIAIAVVFCINPFAGLMLLLWLKLLAPVRDRNGDFLVFLLMTTYACLLQSTARWNPALPTDWYGGGYWGIYQSVKDSNFLDFVILKADKELGWRLLTYVAYQCFGDDYFYFINGVAIFTIIMTCSSIYLFWKTTRTNCVALIASLAIYMWFTEYVSTLNNITRQMFALSLMTYAYVRTAAGAKTCWWAMIGACSIHTLMFIFAPFVFARSLCQSLKPSVMLRIASVIAGFALVITYAPVLAKMLDQVSFLSYGLQRASNAKELIDEWYANPMSIYASAVIVIVICLEINYLGKAEKTTLYFSNILMVLMAMAAATVVMAPALNLRIYVSRFYLFPFVLPYFMRRYRLAWRFYASLIVVFFGYRFFASFDALRGGGFFPEISDLIKYSVFDFLTSA